MTYQDMNLEKLRLDHELGRYGLKGAFFGTIIAISAVVIIAIAQLVVGRNVVEGWAFTGLWAAIIIPAIFYGAFVFNRVLSIEGKIKEGEGAFRAKTTGDV